MSSVFLGFLAIFELELLQLEVRFRHGLTDFEEFGRLPEVERIDLKRNFFWWVLLRISVIGEEPQPEWQTWITGFRKSIA